MSTILRSVQGRLFLFCVVTTIVLVIALAMAKWEALQKNAYQELNSVYSLVRESAQDRLEQQELMLKLLGNRLQEVGGLTDINETIKTLNLAMRDNPVYIAYGIVDPDGELLYMSDDKHLEFPNLLESSKSGKSFLSTLENQHLTIGNTYFAEALEDWIMPVRYAIRDEQGNVDFVLTAVIALNSDFNPWNLANLRNNMQVMVIHEKNSSNEFYLSYYGHYYAFGGTKETAYHQPLPSSFIEGEFTGINKSNNVAADALQQVPKTVDYVHESAQFESMFVVGGYAHDYDVFISVRLYKHRLLIDLHNYIGSCLFIAAVFLTLAYFGLLVIYKNDAKYRAGLKFEATHDQLTGLANRYYLVENFDTWYANHNQLVSMIFIDIDNFKQINEHFTHDVGDKVLKQVAKRLKQLETRDSMLIRHGGDEFLLLLPTTDQKLLEATANNILYYLSAPIVNNEIIITISASMGIASTSQGQHTDLKLLLKVSDLALLEAKKVKNRWAFYSNEVKIWHEKRLAIESHIQHALDNNEFSMVYQPQIDSGTQRITGFEALLRWHNKDLGNVSPNDFIPVLENTGMIIEVGKFVIQRAFAEFEQIANLRQYTISINVSVHQLFYSDIYNFISNEIKNFDILPTQVTLEVTESLFIEELSEVQQNIALLKNDGFSVSLDDFGTGYSSLSAMRSLPLNELKIDKSFVDNLTANGSDLVMVKQIIEIGHSQGTHVVAEGVETKEQAELLRQLGCDKLQGFLYSKPLPLKEILLHCSDQLKYDPVIPT